MATNFNFGSLDFSDNNQASPSQSRILGFGQDILDLLKTTGEVVSAPSTAIGQIGLAAVDYLGNPTRPSFGEAYSDAREQLPFFSPDPIINPGGPNQEELFGLSEFGSIDRENECKGNYGTDVTPEQCSFLDEQRAIGHVIKIGQSGINPMLDYREPILEQQPLSPEEASFVLPSGEVRTIRANQDVASAFGKGRGTRTFDVDEGSVTVPSNLLAETMGFTVPSLEDIQNALPPEVATEDTFVPDGRSSFFTESAAREQRLRDRERQPGETQTERDTRLARSKTLEGRARAEAGGSGVGRDMTFEEARKLIARREYYSGRKESMKTYNERIRQLQAEYNSGPEKALREANRLANEGKRLNNDVAQARLDEYRKTQTEKYQDLVTVAELFIRDGRLTEEQATLYIIDGMGGDIKKLFTEPNTPTPVTTTNTPNDEKLLDRETAEAILDEANGDPEEARRIARERGFTF